MSDATCSDSFIKRDGGLRVNLPVEDVNWFEFFWFSRATTSPHGGWNSKSHWWTRGVQCLTEDAAPALKQWTINSLTEHPSLLPRQRKSEFKLNRSDTASRSSLEQSLLDRKNPLQEASENELSYALFKGGFGKIEPLKGIYMIAYEVPLTDATEGQLKVDLFGRSTNPDAIEIIEIKKAKNTGDSPLMALTEAICYGLQVLRCKEALLKDPTMQESPDVFRQINLTLLAPRQYWDYWTSDSYDWNAISAQFQKITEGVNAGILEKQVDSKLTITLRELTESALR